MSAIVDTYITYRIIKTLVTPWDEQDAYKLGIINDKGKVLKKYRELKTSKEKATVFSQFGFIWLFCSDNFKLEFEIVQ